MTQIQQLVLAALVLMPAAGFALDYKSYPVEHPALAEGVPGAKQVEALKAQLQPVLALSEQETRELLRPMTGFLEIKCPNCKGGILNRQLTWSIQDPHHCKCKFCDHVYPSDKYPMDKVKVVVDPTGERQEYPYWEGPDGYPHYFQAKIDYETQHYFSAIAYRLAQLYTATGEEQYARRAAVILQRLAEIYPHFSVHGIADTKFRAPTFYPFEKPYPYYSGRWGQVWFYAELDGRAFRTYTQLFNSGQFEKLSEEVGRDVKQQIREDLLRAQVDFTLNCPISPRSNMIPGVCGRLAIAGRVLGTPDYVHIGVDINRDMLKQLFFADGMWYEGTISYHRQTVGGIRSAMAQANGYSDPPGYTYEKDGSRFDNLQVSSDMPFLQEATDAANEFAYPDGSHLCVHDTHDAGRYKQTKFSADLRSKLLYGMGQATLRSGEGKQQAVLGLHFSGSHGHAHCDYLDLTLFARQHELMPDLGYTLTPYRDFLSSTAGHNTVVVDESNCHAGARKVPWAGKLVLWEPEGTPARVVSVDCPEAYAQTSVYHRTCALVDTPGGGHYVFDIFRVVGGTKHDYHIKGDPRTPPTAVSYLPLTERGHSLLGPGLEFMPHDSYTWAKRPDGRYNEYALLKDMASATTDAPWRVKFESEDGTGLNIALMTDGEAEVCTVTYPTLRQAKEDAAKVEEARSPALVVRRHGEDLSSTFVGVLEPFVDSSPSLQAEPLYAADELVGAWVMGADFQDWIVFLREKPDQPRPVTDKLRTSARFLLVRVTEGRTQMQVIDGAAQFGDLKAESPPEIGGEVTAADGEKRTVTIASDGAEADLKGRYVIIDHADGATSLFEIAGAKRDGEHLVLTLSEPPDFELTAEGAHFLSYPIREIKGKPTARILMAGGSG